MVTRPKVNLLNNDYIDCELYKIQYIAKHELKIVKSFRKILI